MDESRVYIKSKWVGPPYARYKVYTLCDNERGYLFTVDEYSDARAICDRLNS